ncbi:flagellin [Rhizobium sp. CG4]|jgi:flagellin|uniref:flagellin N-terminal helical domain-containing protein n=1 Tax=Rhizobium/Agrobacterium group TaxID=227290 RepID=UPI001781B0AE|nr:MULTISPECIES: flagellin [Rhizobium/Agrobacterium group]MBD9387305.1 flagellin [Agrobacterium sp. AGB01]MCM2454319.1 flagellin [Rhizobium sp. CG4]MCS4240960.1 flagellin [Rhizobium sp. BIGb0125]MDO5896507.1 flagellin [Agrobacterium sp. Azo12]
MASILTNVSAMSALQTLRSINSNLEKTQNNISTGQRVSQASDNAAYWSIATTMRSDNGALSAVQDAIGLGAAKVDTAYSGMESAIEVVKEIKKKLVTAQEGSVDSKKVQEEITQLQEQLKSIAESASFSGENMIAGSGTQSVISGFVRDSSGGVSVKKTDYVMKSTGTDANVLFGTNTAGALVTTAGILGATSGALGISVNNLDVTNTSTGYLDQALTAIESALTKMTSAGAELGSVSTRIDMQEDFIAKLNASLERGIGRLVDADMNEESTRLKALQTQQQLAIQSLSIANSDSQNILSLFR